MRNIQNYRHMLSSELEIPEVNLLLPLASVEIVQVLHPETCYIYTIINTLSQSKSGTVF